MNGTGSSSSSSSRWPAREWAPQGIPGEEYSPVTRALEAVFLLQGPSVRRPPKRPMVQGEGEEEYWQVPSPEPAEPDWKQLQAERIRAWRQKALEEPHRAVGGDQAQSRFRWQSKEYQGTARPRKGDTPGEETHQLPGDPGQQVQAPSGQQIQAPSGQQIQAPSGQQVQGPSGQQVQGPSGQQIQAPSGQQIQGPSGQQIQGPSGQQIQGETGFIVTGQRQAKCGEEQVLQIGEEPRHHLQEDTGLAWAGQLGTWLDLASCHQQEDTRHVETAEESCDEEEACLAPCSDAESEDVAPKEQHEAEPDRVCRKKEKSKKNDSGLIQRSEQGNHTIRERRSLGTNPTENKSRLEPDFSCNATVQLKREQVDMASGSLFKGSGSSVTKTKQPGLSRSEQQGEDTALASIQEHQSEKVAEESEKPAADKSWAVCQAAKIKAWREAKSRELLQVPSGLNVEAGIGDKKELMKSMPDNTVTGLETWREVDRKRVLEPVKEGELYGLSKSSDQDKHTTLSPGSVDRVREPRTALETQLGVPQNIEHREYMELASSRGQQAEKECLTPVSEHRESISSGKLKSDKSWALCQAAKIKAWREAASREGSTVLPSRLNEDATINPKQGAVGTIPVHQIHIRRDSSHRGELNVRPRSPNVEAVHTTSQWAVESTRVRQVYKSKHGLEAQRREERTIAPSNPNIESVHNTKQWAVERMHVHQGPKLKIGVKAPGREELNVTPSVPNAQGVYGDKRWGEESNSVHQTRGTAAELDASSSGKSSLVPGYHNGKAGQLAVDSFSVHQTSRIKPWWQIASIGESDLERTGAKHSIKQGAVKSIPVHTSPRIGSWREPASRGKDGLLNIKAAHNSKWGTVESIPVCQTAGIASCREAVSTGESAFTREQTMAAGSQHAVDQKAAQRLPNDVLAWWGGVGYWTGHQADKVQSWHQGLTRGTQDWSSSGRNAAKLQTKSSLSFIESEKKRMKDWAQSVWSQTASTQEPSLKPMSLQLD